MGLQIVQTRHTAVTSHVTITMVGTVVMRLAMNLVVMREPLKTVQVMVTAVLILG